MNHFSPLLITIALLSETQAQDVKRNTPYDDPATKALFEFAGEALKE